VDRTGLDVGAHLSAVPPAVRRRDAETLVDLYSEVTGRRPEMWSSGIVGFGACHYRYPTGTEGDMPLAAFAPRKASMTVYLMEGFAEHADTLARLGPHTTSVSCLYLKDLSAVALDVLRELVAESYAWAATGGSEGIEITPLD